MEQPSSENRPMHENYTTGLEGMTQPPEPVDLEQAYEEFAPMVDQLRRQLAAENEGEPGELPVRKLGSGDNSDAYVISVNGRDYVVRIPQDAGDESGEVEKHIHSSEKVRGLPHFEQLVAVSREVGVTVAELMPGEALSGLSPDKLSEISDEHLNGLVDIVLAGYEAGAKVDPNPTNLLYDAETGFGIVDLNGVEEASTEVVIATVAHLPAVLSRAGIFGRRPRTVEDYAYFRQQAEAVLPALERFKAVLGQRFSGDQLEAITGSADRIIEETKESLAQYADEDWVRGEVKAEESR